MISSSIVGVVGLGCHCNFSLVTGDRLCDIIREKVLAQVMEGLHATKQLFTVGGNICGRKNRPLNKGTFCCHRDG